MTETNFNTYDFLINDGEEVMLLLYAQTTTPKDSFFELDKNTASATLFRTPDNALTLNDIPSEIIDALQNVDNILICELNKTEKEEDTQIVHAYEASIIHL